MRLRCGSTFALAALLESARLFAADGSYDVSWGSGGVKQFDIAGNDSISAKLVALPSGKLLLAGTCVDGNRKPWMCATSLLANGDYDTTFGPTSNGRVRFDTFPSFPESYGFAVAALSDGRTVLAGNTAIQSVQGIVAILKPDGTLDTSVGSHRGWLTFDFDSAITTPKSFVTSVALQPDGKIIVAGYAQTTDDFNFDFAAARLMPDISGLDTSFGNNGVKIVGFDLATSPATDDDEVNAIGLQSNGSIILAGYAYTDVSYEAALVRLTSAGQIDTTFGSGGKVLQHWATGSSVKAIALTRDGRITLAGYTSDSGLFFFTANRLLSDGSQDPTFRGNCEGLPPPCMVGPASIGFYRTGETGDFANAIALQSDGKILLAGRSEAMGGGQFAVVRLNEDGGPDMSFGDGAGRSAGSFGGSVSDAYSVVITNGGILVSGDGTRATGNSTLFGLSKLKLDLVFTNDFE